MVYDILCRQPAMASEPRSDRLILFSSSQSFQGFESVLVFKCIKIKCKKLWGSCMIKTRDWTHSLIWKTCFQHIDLCYFLFGGTLSWFILVVMGCVCGILSN